MMTATPLRAGFTAAIGLVIGAVSISAAVALVTAPLTPRLANAQTVDLPSHQQMVATAARGTVTANRR